MQYIFACANDKSAFKAEFLIQFSDLRIAFCKMLKYFDCNKFNESVLKDP